MLQIFFIILFRISLKIPSLCMLAFILKIRSLQYAYIYSYFMPQLFSSVILPAI